MASVLPTMPPFHHEFYAIALRNKGNGNVRAGLHSQLPEGPVIFFNSPFQILSWDIAPDWNGYYIMFSSDFITASTYLQDILEHFAFLKIEKNIPFAISESEAKEITHIFESINQEYCSNHKDKFMLIESYVLLLLNSVKRHFHRQVSEVEANKEIRKTDIRILARFQALIETSFQPDDNSHYNDKVHATTYYAQKIAIHPNHLNAVVKSITGLTAKQHIQRHVIRRAKARLLQTNLSAKEIAYDLHFNTPNQFSNLFKRFTGKTPLAFRKSANL